MSNACELLERGAVAQREAERVEGHGHVPQPTPTETFAVRPSPPSIAVHSNGG
jgi:hypothetical protein